MLPTVQSPSELDVDLGADDARQLLAQGLDDRTFAGERQAVVVAFGAPPRHRLALVAPVVARPAADGGDLAAGAVAGVGPLHLDRQLPADGRLPLGRRLVVGDGLDVERAARTAREAGPVEEDAG